MTTNTNWRRNLVTAPGLLLIGALFALGTSSLAACGDDDDDDGANGSAGSATGGRGGSGGAAGTSGRGTGGMTNTMGSAGAGGGSGASGSAGTSGGGGGGASGAGGASGNGGGGAGGGGNPTGVVINEIFINPPGDNDEGCYIEIKGPPGTSLNGYKVRGANGSAMGATYVEMELFPTDRIDASGYFVLIQDDSVEVPEGGSLGLDGRVNLQNGPDNVLLVDPSGAIVDAVGYSDTGGAFPNNGGFVGEGTFAVQPNGDNATASLSRLPNGRDTNNNSADFAPGVPTPGADNVSTGVP